MPWKIRKSKGSLETHPQGPNHNQYKVYGERGNPLSKEWKTKAEAVRVRRTSPSGKSS